MPAASERKLHQINRRIDLLESPARRPLAFGGKPIPCNTSRAAAEQFRFIENQFTRNAI